MPENKSRKPLDRKQFQQLRAELFFRAARDKKNWFRLMEQMFGGEDASG